MVLAGMACWVVLYGWNARVVKTERYTFTDSQREDLKYFSKAHYDYGVFAWFENDLNNARACFTDSITRNYLNIGAWLKLAQVEAAKKNTDKAIRILAFTDNLTQSVVKWKWQQIILAGELGVDDIFFNGINYVIPFNDLTNDALQLLDIYFKADVGETINALAPDNLPYYLKWLIKWQRSQDTILVWNRIKAEGIVDNKLAEYYINFLINQKNVQQAAIVRLESGGMEGMTNSDFEKPISNTGVGWRKATDKNNQLAVSRWDIRRVNEDSRDGNHGIRISFFGKSNVDFYHFYQIVPVLASKNYALTYLWRSQNLTTDQRPFINAYCFDCEGSWQSEMISPDSDWHAQRLIISVPEKCHALVIRVRRKVSHRFDSKIDGTMWLDNFSLNIIDNNQ